MQLCEWLALGIKKYQNTPKHTYIYVTHLKIWVGHGRLFRVGAVVG